MLSFPVALVGVVPRFIDGSEQITLITDVPLMTWYAWAICSSEGSSGVQVSPVGRACDPANTDRPGYRC